MLNKKATLAIGLIPLIALVASIAALLSFIQSDTQITGSSIEISELIEELNFNHQYVVAQSNLIAAEAKKQCSSCSNQQLKDKIKEISIETENRYRFPGAGNFYGKIRNNEFEIKNNTLIIQSLFVESNAGENKLTRNFNLEILIE